ncbi:hypothetical protein FHX77_000272 [Bifidobacterium commune]|nr:hypothetical protein [Bifidobacterium commune]
MYPIKAKGLLLSPLDLVEMNVNNTATLYRL